MCTPLRYVKGAEIPRSAVRFKNGVLSCSLPLNDSAGASFCGEVEGLLGGKSKGWLVGESGLARRGKPYAQHTDY